MPLTKEAIQGLQFDQEATRIIFKAVEEAAASNHNYVGTEHLTLAAAREPRVNTALKDHGSSGRRVIESITFITSKGDPNRFRLGDSDLTPRLGYLIGLAAASAENHAANPDAPVVITTQSLLTGLIQEGEGIGAGVLGVVLDGREQSFIQRVSEVPREDPEFRLRGFSHPLETALLSMLGSVFHATLQAGELTDGNYIRCIKPVMVNGKALNFTYTRSDPTVGKDATTALALDLLEDGVIERGTDDELKKALRQKVIERDGYFSQASALMYPDYYNANAPVERWPEQIMFSITADSSNEGKPEIVGLLNIPVRLANLEVFNSTPNRVPGLSIRLPKYDDLIRAASSLSYRRRPHSEAGLSISPIPYYKDPQATADQLGRFINGLL